MVQSLSQMRGGEAEREAETDGRNVIMDDHLEDIQQHHFTHRYHLIIFITKSMLKPNPDI